MKITKTSLKEIDDLVYKSRVPKGKHPNWVDNKRLHEHLVKYHEEKMEAIARGEEIPPIRDEFIGKSIINIVMGMAHNYRFRNYYANWKSDMISDAIEIALRYTRSYDPYRKDKEGNLAKPNPHAYISMIVYNAFIQRIKKEKDEEYIKKRAYLEFGGFAAENEDLSVYEDFDVDMGNFYQNYVADVAIHEAKIEERKNRYKKSDLQNEEDDLESDITQFESFFEFEKEEDGHQAKIY